MAILEWNKLKDGENTPLERALGAFDMFVLGTGQGDFVDVCSNHHILTSNPGRFSFLFLRLKKFFFSFCTSQIIDCLDRIVALIAAEYSDLSGLTPRQKAAAIAQYLTRNNLTGIDPEKEIYNIEHNFLGIALMDPEHNSLPLVSAAIYCYVAQKFGLNAKPCGFPFHVRVIIHPENGHDMDGRQLVCDERGAPIYMDPFQSAEETPVAELQEQLNFLGAHTRLQSTFLRESLVTEIVLRCGKNILNSVLQTPHFRDTSLDIVNVKYAALWSSMLLSQYASPDTPILGQPRRRHAGNIPLRRHLPSLIEHFATEFPSDVHLIEQYIIPLFEGLPEYGHLRETVRVMKAGDEIPKQVRRRTPDVKNVTYRVGQVFRHRRYEYTAIVTGWDTECDAGEQWMQRMGVDRLNSGKNQSFYHVL